MENPGTFNESREQHPDLSDAQLLALYQGALVEWKKYCQERSQDVIELQTEPRELA